MPTHCCLHTVGTARASVRTKVQKVAEAVLSSVPAEVWTSWYLVWGIGAELVFSMKDISDAYSVLFMLDSIMVLETTDSTRHVEKVAWKFRE
jgi:hypothetical protein